ncbi:hypothetical protein MIND_00274800 [Mycena indigotica]|uniref:Uncharacterized protein n=1 Tax=Mycena indigotica TaxID=2126181 RepID=A0A8H6T940_9AGAR|nr:uncharacterized protein MIND_00274800 [Mycena indigotica]KAF7312607.1 hypothetical protein MIND_00274800 [Mycena indigotica]
MATPGPAPPRTLRGLAPHFFPTSRTPTRSRRPPMVVKIDSVEEDKTAHFRSETLTPDGLRAAAQDHLKTQRRALFTQTETLAQKHRQLTAFQHRIAAAERRVNALRRQIAVLEAKRRDQGSWAFRTVRWVYTSLWDAFVFICAWLFFTCRLWGL